MAESGRSIKVPMLARMRLRAGLTQRELAVRSGVSRPTIANAELGRPITAPILRKLAYALDVKTWELTDEKELVAAV